MVALCFAACGKKADAPAADTKSDAPSIVGTWKYEGGNYIYTFNADGTGTYDLGSSKMEFTYTTTDKVLSITYTGNTSPMELEYILDGNTLNVKDSFGNDTIYKKQ